MAKVTRKSPKPITDMDQLTPTTKGKKKAKIPCQPRSRVGGKVPKATTKVKKLLQRCSSKKASEKSPVPIRKPKKARGPTLFGHYHRLNEKLDKNEPDHDQKSVANTISSDDLDIQ
ncbi:uncharacterized protein CXorf51A-like [Eulemur rufifrons]|uniref:uncharacterized protein CXorf51A-like n=1 Tax=Eulemur rufifrons TaxID=859984 RepID=UPI00374227AF